MTLTGPPDPSTSITDDHQTASESDVPALDYYPDLIEVTFDTDIDIETLLLYFEGKRSGGNRTKEAKSIKTIEQGVVHVKFQSSEGNRMLLHLYLYFIFDRCSSCYFTGEAFTYEE